MLEFFIREARNIRVRADMAGKNAQELCDVRSP